MRILGSAQYGLKVGWLPAGRLFHSFLCLLGDSVDNDVDVVLKHMLTFSVLVTSLYQHPQLGLGCSETLRRLKKATLDLHNVKSSIWHLSYIFYSV